MKQHSTDTPELVRHFAPKERRRDDIDPADRTGAAIIAALQQADNVSKADCDRAMDLAHKLSVQLRTVEDRVNELQAEIEYFQNRAVRAEMWLQVIQKEIEDKLIAPMADSRLEQPSLH
jgi:hypothetical protein